MDGWMCFSNPAFGNRYIFEQLIRPLVSSGSINSQPCAYSTKEILVSVHIFFGGFSGIYLPSQRANPLVINHILVAITGHYPAFFERNPK